MSKNNQTSLGMALQVVADVLGEETATAFRAVLQSYINHSSCPAREEYTQLVGLLHHYKTSHAQARVAVSTEIGGSLMGEE